MTLREKLLSIFMSSDSEEYSDDEIKQLLHSETLQNCILYQNFHTKQFANFYDVPEIRKLIILRIFSSELWEEICKSEYGHKKEFERRINVIGKAYSRMLVNIDENICLLEKGENEAIRFQDFADAQQMKIADKNPNIVFKTKYTKQFYKANGWISDDKIKTIKQMVNDLEWRTEYKKMYNFSSEFVHASPESIEIVSRLNRELENDKFAYFPLGFEHQIELNVYLIQDFTKLIIDCFVEDASKKLDLFLLDAVVKWM